VADGAGEQPGESSGPHGGRWAWAEIDVGAVAHNVGVLRATVAPASIWAVVKADGYGHGAVEVGRTALGAGAAGLCVALVSEAVALRTAGVTAPILVLSEQPSEQAVDIVAHRLIATVATLGGIAALAAAAEGAGGPSGADPSGGADGAGRAGRGSLAVHLKIDTGMHRVGAAPGDAAALVAAIAARPSLRLAGVFTHLAVADELADPETDCQLQRFDEVLAELPDPPSRADRHGVDDEVAVHAANSAGALAHAGARRSLVRAGIALYGVSPGPDLDALATPLRPVMSLKARVSFVKRLRAGERLSYGLRHTMPADANVATVPIGYADGVRRSLSGRGAPVLIGGRRREIIGTITMDQLMVDCGDDDVAVGDEVVLIGGQGAEQIRAEEWADRLDTIGYEIVCGIGARVPRRYVR